jgi:hypothetical protein
MKIATIKSINHHTAWMATGPSGLIMAVRDDGGRGLDEMIVKLKAEGYAIEFQVSR